MFCKFYFMYKLREILTVLQMNIITEALNLMSEDPFDGRKGRNLKMQSKRAFQMTVFR